MERLAFHAVLYIGRELHDDQTLCVAACYCLLVGNFEIGVHLVGNFEIGVYCTPNLKPYVELTENRWIDRSMDPNVKLVTNSGRKFVIDSTFGDDEVACTGADSQLGGYLCEKCTDHPALAHVVTFKRSVPVLPYNTFPVSMRSTTGRLHTARIVSLGLEDSGAK